MYHSQENLSQNHHQHYQQQQRQHDQTVNNNNHNSKFNKKHPVSILKRFDSSEKMYPISRPASNLANNHGSQSTLFMNQNDVPTHSNNINNDNNPYAFQMNIQTGGGIVGVGNASGTFPRNKQQLMNLQQQGGYPLEQINDLNSNSGIYDQHHQKVRNAVNTPNIQQIRQKRVQFANIPPSPANQTG